MSRLLALFFSFLVFSIHGHGGDLQVTVTQVDAAIEQTQANMDAADPARENLLKIYRDTRAMLLYIEKEQTKLEAYAAARVNAYEEAQRIRADLEKSPSVEVVAPDDSMVLVELEQIIQLGKSDLSVLHNRSADISGRKDSEADRPSGIRARLSALGALQPDLEANLKLMSKTAKAGSLEEARGWLAEAQYAANRAEKASLDEELLSRPMRLELLSARQDQITQQIAITENHLQAIERQASDLREGEAQEVLAAAESAQAEALGKHQLVQELADRNAVFSASLGERSAAIEGFRARELESAGRAEQFERELKTIERKLGILGMAKTLGEILREQAVRLPGRRMTERELAAIAELVGASSLRQMELQDERRELRDIETYLDAELAGQDVAVVQSVAEDFRQLALNRRELVNHAIEIEATYARALTDLDFAVHRLAEAVDQYRGFISERLLWIQSRDPISWSIASDLPGQLLETFAPGQWLRLIQWLVRDILEQPLILLLLLLVGGLLYLEPRIRARLVATGHAVGFVRNDSFVETLKAFSYSLVLMLKWPLLMLAFALPLEYYEEDTGLAGALYFSLVRTVFYFLGLEFIRCLLLPRGLVESHFRWPAQRVTSLYRRVIRFEQTLLPAAFIASLFLHLYPTEVGGAVGTIAVVASLLSLAYFFYRMPHFVQDKMDHFFAEPKARLNSSWGTLVRALLAWSPLAMTVAVLFGYTYTAVEFSMLLMQTVVLFTGMLLAHELGMRWLRVTRRRLHLKVQEGQLQSQGGSEDSETNIEEEILEHDPDLLDDEGTKFLNALLLLGSVLGIAMVWSEVFPALGILDSVELWQRTDSVNGEDLLVQITLADLFGALLIGLLGWVVVRRIPSLLEILLRQRMEVGAASAYAVATVLKYVLTTVVVITVLSMLGGSWSQIQWAVAALSLGIGFGLQEIVANFFSGLIILFEQPIRVGDTVTVGETSGVVTKIQMRATTIRDWDRRELLVPNKEFVTGRLLNWSLTDPVTRIHITVGVAYGTDMDRALETVRQAALNHPLILDDPPPFVTFEEFGDNALHISLRCYLEELDKRLSTASAIRLDINRGLNEAGISVAFPQRDVHLDARDPLEIRLVDSLPRPAPED